MIRRLYVDNFRSLVDFTWEPGKETLVLGYNGSGKTSALEVVEFVKNLCTGVNQLFMDVGSNDRTSWDNVPTIKVEIDIEVSRGLYRYELVVGFETIGWTDVVSETLYLDDRKLFGRERQKVQLETDGQPGAFFPISVTQSVVAVVGSEFGGEDIVPFREYLQSVLYLKPSPLFIYAHKAGTVSSPEPSLDDLVPWYLYLATKAPGFVASVTDDLRNVWPELVEILTPEYSPDVFDFVLKVKGDSPSGAFLEVPLRVLSDGERILIGLYVVAAFQRTHPPTTIIIDEPDNFVSLLELQPWLLTMLDGRPDGGQIILVSHNPNIIETMDYAQAAYFTRADHLSPTRVRKVGMDETGLSLSERLSRGWLDE